MLVKPNDYKFDVFEVARLANPKAAPTITTKSDGYHFQWEWEGKTHNLFIASEKLVFPDLVLERLFEAAIEMAQK